mmetsp:Transcript_33289/g.94323  ORF Transcript_33289/g.94323 Transcript_33289/m.94323 type:complete len:228 (+) Transcript_33289:538-1221(+)
MGFCPCMELVRWTLWVTAVPPGCSADPEAGSNRSCMNLGTATCMERFPMGLPPVLVIVASASVISGWAGFGLENDMTISTPSLSNTVTGGTCGAACDGAGWGGCEAGGPKRSSRLVTGAGAAAAAEGGVRSKPSKSWMGSTATAGAAGALLVLSRSIPIKSASASTLGAAAAGFVGDWSRSSEDCRVLAPVAFMYSASVRGGMCSMSCMKRPGAGFFNSLSNSHERC